MTTRIDKRFADLKRQGRAALVTFVTAGDPDYETSFRIIKGLPKAGADIIEFGMPFTDPMADGPAIQEAGLRALKAGRAPGLGAYTTYSEMVAQITARVAAYPGLASMSSIGTSHEGRDLWALKISDNVGIDEDEPEVFYMGNHHARELITVMIPLAIADSLLLNYGSNPRFTEFVDQREIWIVPTVNPDGFVYVENVNTNWRKNRRNNGGGSYGVDLNRNYDYQWGHDNNGSSSSPSSDIYRGPSPASEPEIQAVQNFVDSHSFVFSISYHSYGNWWLWGPGYKPGLGVDQDVFAGYGEIVEGLETVGNFYGGYGEVAPDGNGPVNGQAAFRGNEYLSAEFPELTQILSISIEDDPDAL